MAKTIKLQGTQVVFPSTCIVCQGRAAQSYKVERIFTYGRRTITISLPVPMCEQHYLQATTKSPAEKLVGKIGLIGGALVGFVTMIALLLYWDQTGQGSLILNIAMGAIAGLGFFLIIWVLVLFWVAPLFAFPASKLARNSVRFSRYEPRYDRLSIQFTNDQVAEAFRQANGSNVVE